MNKRTVMTSALMLGCFVAGCGTQPASNDSSQIESKSEPEAESIPVEVRELTEKVETAGEMLMADHAPGGVYNIQESSYVEFVGSKKTGRHTGRFNTVSGMVAYIPNAPEQSSVSVTIRLDSMETDDARLTQHLKSADFFDVGQFAEAKFRSQRIEKDGDQYKVSGVLIFHGVEKSITFPATLTANEGKLHIVSHFELNRMDFGVTYPGKADDPISEQVQINLDIHAAPGGPR